MTATVKVVSVFFPGFSGLTCLSFWKWKHYWVKTTARHYTIYSITKLSVSIGNAAWWPKLSHSNLPSHDETCISMTAPELAWMKCCFGWRIQHWITTLQFRKTMETSLWHFFCSWSLTSSIVCLILSKIILSISTTAFTALRVAGLLEPVKTIKTKTLGEHAKAIQKDPGSQKKKEWTTALPCRPWQCSTTFPSCPFLHIFFAAVLLVKKGVLVKERNSKTKEITMRETMQ